MDIKLGRLKGEPFYPWQVEALEFIQQKAYQSDKRFVCVRGDTGLGKSEIGMHCLKPPLGYMCLTIDLQEQLVNDFSEAVLLKGKRNYPCGSGEFENADECFLDYCDSHCPYQSVRAKFIRSKYGIVNFHYFLNAANFTTTMFYGDKEDAQLRNIIIDEADTIDNVLVSFIAFEFRFAKLEVEELITHVPDKKTKIESVIKWLKHLTGNVEQIHIELADIVSEIKSNIKQSKSEGGNYRLSGDEQITIKRFKFIDNLRWKVHFLMDQDLTDNWVYYHDGTRITLKPKWLTRELTDRFLFNHGNKFVFMSATLPSKEIFCGLLDLEADEVEYLDMEPVYLSEKRRIVFTPRYNAIKETNKDELRVDVKKTVSDILDEEKGRGLIHCVSYDLGNYLKGLSPRLIFHTSNNRRDQFARYKKIPGAVIVSPSLTRGVDLPNELCEFIIILKAPYAYLGDPQINARVYGSGKFGRLWYASYTIQTIVQMAGRGFRHKDDKCTVYMTDEQIGKLLKKHSKLWAKWFIELIDIDF